MAITTMTTALFHSIIRSKFPSQTSSLNFQQASMPLKQCNIITTLICCNLSEVVLWKDACFDSLHRDLLFSAQ